MQGTKGLLDRIKQHDKLNIRVTSNRSKAMPAEVLKRLLQPHRTTFYLFVFLDRGSSTYRLDMEDITLSGGQLLFVLPHQVFMPPPIKEGIEYFKAGFDENTLALLPKHYPFLVNPLQKKVITFDPVSKLRVKAVFELLNQLLHSDKAQSLEIILAHLNTLLTEINCAYFKGSHQDKVSSRLSKYIEFKVAVETHLTEQHSIHSIAEKLNVTTSSLYGIVKENSGVSPKEFITNRLILEAQRKLHYSRLSVKELAYELGFNDPDYFSRLFKKSTGKSVSNYLSSLQDLSGN